MLPEEKQRVIALIAQALAGLGIKDVPVVLERPKVEAHGDLACTVALQVARNLKKNPREVATAIADAVKLNPAATGLIDSVEIAGPGFINLRIAAAAKQSVVHAVLREGDCFGTSAAGGGRKQRKARAGPVQLYVQEACRPGRLAPGEAAWATLGLWPNRALTTTICAAWLCSSHVWWRSASR